LGVTAIVLLVGICGMMVTFEAARSDFSGPNPQPGPGTAIAAGGLTLLMVLSWVGPLSIYALMITGHVFCLTAPAKYGARLLAYLTLILALADLFLSMGGGVLGLSLAAVPPTTGLTTFLILAELVALVPWICTVAHLLVFLLFLRAVALGVEAYSLAETLVGVMIVFGLGSGVYLGASAVAVVTGSELILLLAVRGELDLTSASDVGIVLGVIAGLGFLVWLAAMVWYINTLFSVRNAVGLYIEGKTWTPTAP
jgi:hypothetical protein